MTIRDRFSLAARLDGLAGRTKNTLRYNWHMGFTSFGGPPVHFKIFHDKFVKKLEWIDEQVYQELFSICQSLCGPASTKMHYCINLLHDGFIPAVLGFLIWSLPGAIGMFGLALGVSNIGESLPRAAYALLSGLNAATVGIVALAAVQLSEKAATDRLTRALVFLSGAAGLMYNALWYFPVLMVICGTAAVVHDSRWMQGPIRRAKRLVRRLGRRRQRQEPSEEEPGVELDDDERRRDHNGPVPAPDEGTDAAASLSAAESEPRIVPTARRLNMTWKSGLAVIVCFFISFAIVIALRGALPNPIPRLFALFANMYLAGTIIFGGGPVVIPLLREYVVAEGWVTPRDFLLGLAIIQSFPGPNFNFAVYLGALTAANAGQNSAAGALVAWAGIFLPGLVLVHGTMGVWSAIRGWRWVKSAIRGLNAGAVGLIYTAVYRLWQIGYIDEGYEQGTSLALEPWWVVVTATSYIGGYWFNVSPPVAIIAGGVMGMIWYGVVTT